MSPWRRRLRREPAFPELVGDTPLVAEDELRSLVDAHLGAGDPTGWFEPAYALAVASRSRLPWQEGSPHPWVTAWLEEPVVTPPGERALVVGCGVGDDAAAVAAAGFAVTAVDIAPTALAWAAARHPQASAAGLHWVEGDLLAPPPAWLGAFDLVLEVHTVPWLPGVVRDAAMAEIGRCVAPGGALLVIAEVATSDDHRVSAAGPPWPQAPSELVTYRTDGLLRLAMEHAAVEPGAEAPASMEVRATFQRPHGTPPG